MTNTIFSPELIEAGITSKLGLDSKLYPISYVKDLGNKQGGDVITVPKTAYIGDAETVEAGELIPVSDFTQSTDQVTVAKYGKAVSFTQEEVNNAYGDVRAEAENQLSIAVNKGIEGALFNQLKAINGAMKHTESTKSALDVEVIADALVKFGEDLDGEKYLFVSPAQFANLRKDDNFVLKANDKVDSVGEIYGCTVVVSERVDSKEAFIVKPEALGIYIKKDAEVEVDKDISNQTYLVVGTVHAGVHLRNEQGAIKITLA